MIHQAFFLSDYLLSLDVQVQQRNSEFDTALLALSDQYQRELLIALLDHNPQADDDLDPLDQLGEGDDPTTRKLSLFHNHLPKLEEMGYITWNRDTGKISKGPRWDEIGPLLELINNHRDELPEGWL